VAYLLHAFDVSFVKVRLMSCVDGVTVEPAMSKVNCEKIWDEGRERSERGKGC